MPHPKRQSVTPALRKLLDQREAKGIAHYGESLHSLNQRDPSRDLVEELADAAQYALQLHMERQAIIEELREVRRQLGVHMVEAAALRIDELIEALGAGNPPAEWEGEQASPR